VLDLDLAGGAIDLRWVPPDLPERLPEIHRPREAAPMLLDRDSGLLMFDAGTRRVQAR